MRAAVGQNELTISIPFNQAIEEKVIRYWRAGVHLGDMAERLRLDPDDVAILIIYLVRKGIIKKRPGGVYGKPKKFPDNVREMLGG